MEKPLSDEGLEPSWQAPEDCTKGIAWRPSTRAALPFAIALFIGNVASVLILNYLVPWTSNRFSWWLQPRGANPGSIAVAGTALVVALYGLMIVAFWRLF